MIRTDDSSPGPLELMESAREKYTLAMGRLRHSPPELVLLSLHDSLEDALRSHALRKHLPAATAPFPQLLDALTTDRHSPLSAGEAEGIRRMHRLRARVAHGEHIAVTATTIDAYHRLAARLLPRYGVMVVGPEDEGETADLPPRRPDDVEAIPPRHSPERGRTTTRLSPPPRERSVYPDDEPARYSARPRRAVAERDMPGAAVGRVEVLADRWRRSQVWVLPMLIIVSIFLIGAAISISLQQLHGVQMTPTPVAAASQPSPSAAQVVDNTQAAQPAPTAPAAPTVVATTLPAPPTPGGVAVGRSARVIAEITLNLRERPGTDLAIPILLTLDPNTVIDVVGGPVQMDGLTWWKVRGANIEGWCAGQYLGAR